MQHLFLRHHDRLSTTSLGTSTDSGRTCAGILRLMSVMEVPRLAG